MIDTLHIWLPESELCMDRLWSTIPQKISRATFSSKYNGYQTITGNLENIRVNLSDRGLHLAGSLPKYINGNNILSLTPELNLHAISKLSESLDVEIRKGRITRIDFGYNIIVDYPPKAYFPYFGETRYFERYEQPNSIYYSNINRQILLYDKTKESQQKGVLVPTQFTEKNLIRIEYRINRKIEERLKWKPVHVQDIWDENFILHIENQWKEAYQAIYKFYPINSDFSRAKSPKEFLEFLAIEGIKNLGGEHEVLKIVNQMKLMDQFTHPKYYSRINSKIKSMAKASEAKPSTSHESLIHELNRKVNEVSFL